MEKVVLNITIELDSKDESYRFEEWLKQFVKIKDSQIVPDTKELYDNNTHFRKLVKEYRIARKKRNDFINEHNFKDGTL